MIRFSDAPTQFEKIEDPSKLEGYQSIHPSGDISKMEAQDFWDEIFSEPIEDNAQIENKIKKDVYGRSEDEFIFDVNTNAKEIQEALAPFNTSEWAKLNGFDKEKAIVNLESTIAIMLGVKDRPRIEFFEGDKWDCGSYVPNKNVIKINKNNLDSPSELVNTIAHETRHAYQFQRACNIENYMDFLYAYNFKHYITPTLTENGYINFIEYQDQLVEAEARAFAELFEKEIVGDE